MNPDSESQPTPQRWKQFLIDQGQGQRLEILLQVTAVLAFFLLLLETGYQVNWGRWQTILTRLSAGILIGSYLLKTIGAGVKPSVNLESPGRWVGFRRTPFSWVIVGGFLLVLIVPSVTSLNVLTGLIIYRQFVLWVQRFTRTITGHTLLANIRMKPAQLLALSFALTIAAGSYLLTLPAATTNGSGASWLDALFTATSATCVTGLIVVDTPTYWSGFGQMTILILIQVGGLGIMTLSTSAALIFGKKLGLRHRAVMQDIFDESMAENLTQLIRYIVKLTFGIEAVGAMLLLIRVYDSSTGLAHALYFSVFHSISAFCNAGFALYSDSLVKYVHDVGVNLIITTLIILGGLGYTVMAGLFVTPSHRRRLRFWWKAQPLHTKLSLTMTVLLISVGTISVFFFEFDNALLPLPLGGKLMAAYFQSVTTRTAGFNTIAFDHLEQPTLFLMIILMFIGACSGSTGGGIKTSTMAVLLLSVRSIVRGQEQVVAFGRTISQSVVFKAAVIAVISIGLVLSLFFLLMLVEPRPFLALAFESVSAFATVGLSTGLTPLLTSAGKLIIIILMYVGRIGPLTLALAIGEPGPASRINYPEGRVLVG